MHAWIERLHACTQRASVDSISSLFNRFWYFKSCLVPQCDHNKISLGDILHMHAHTGTAILHMHACTASTANISTVHELNFLKF